jgi:hypothetical protein
MYYSAHSTQEIRMTRPRVMVLKIWRRICKAPVQVALPTIMCGFAVDRNGEPRLSTATQ